jgi:hypothetical protein
MTIVLNQKTILRFIIVITMINVLIHTLTNHNVQFQEVSIYPIRNTLLQNKILVTLSLVIPVNLLMNVPSM